MPKTHHLAGGKAFAADEYQQHNLVGFHTAHYAGGHGPTNYTRWVATNKYYWIRYQSVSPEQLSLGLAGMLPKMALRPCPVDCCSTVALLPLEVCWPSVLLPWSPLAVHRALHRRQAVPPLALQGYEPYVIVSRRFCPWYDERFRGYGYDKIQQLEHLASGRGWSWGCGNNETNCQP